MNKTKLRILYAVLFIIIFCVEVFLALYVHDNFFRPYFGDFLVVILIYCFIRIFIPQKLRLLPLYVFIFSVAVEFAQYIHIVDLLGLSGNKLATTVIGTGFDVLDILCYACGCITCAIIFELPAFFRSYKEQ